MKIQMVDKLNMTPIGQDRETLTFKALLYLIAAVHMQVCGVYPIVHLGYPTITNIFVFNQIICYNGVFVVAKTPL